MLTRKQSRSKARPGYRGRQGQERRPLMLRAWDLFRCLHFDAVGLSWRPYFPPGRQAPEHPQPSPDSTFTDYNAWYGTLSLGHPPPPPPPLPRALAHAAVAHADVEHVESAFAVCMHASRGEQLWWGAPMGHSVCYVVCVRRLRVRQLACAPSACAPCCVGSGPTLDAHHLHWCCYTIVCWPVNGFGLYILYSSSTTSLIFIASRTCCAPHCRTAAVAPN